MDSSLDRVKHVVVLRPRSVHIQFDVLIFFVQNGRSLAAEADPEQPESEAAEAHSVQSVS